MCLAVPARVVALDGDEAVVDLGGVRTNVNVALIEDPALGDHVVIHTGVALARIDPAEAEAMYAALVALGEAEAHR